MATPRADRADGTPFEQAVEQDFTIPEDADVNTAADDQAGSDR